MSPGRKIRELTANSAIKKTTTIKKGAMNCRKIPMSAIARMYKTVMKQLGQQPVRKPVKD